jgi:hypothetical protein
MRYQSDDKSLKVRKIFSNYAFSDLPVLKLLQTSLGVLRVKIAPKKLAFLSGQGAEGTGKWSRSRMVGFNLSGIQEG